MLTEQFAQKESKKRDLFWNIWRYCVNSQKAEGKISQPSWVDDGERCFIRMGQQPQRTPDLWKHNFLAGGALVTVDYLSPISSSFLCHWESDTPPRELSASLFPSFNCKMGRVQCPSIKSPLGVTSLLNILKLLRFMQSHRLMFTMIAGKVVRGPKAKGRLVGM